MEEKKEEELTINQIFMNESWILQVTMKLYFSIYSAKSKWKLKAKQISYKERVIRLISLKFWKEIWHPSRHTGNKRVKKRGKKRDEKGIIKFYILFRKFKSHHPSDSNSFFPSYFCNFVKKHDVLRISIFSLSFFCMFLLLMFSFLHYFRMQSFWEFSS